MKKEVYLTAGLCRVKDQIAEAARNPAAEKTADAAAEASPAPVSVLSSMPDETRKAVLERCRDYEHSRQDLRFRLHEAAARTAQAEAVGRQQTDALLARKKQFDALRLQLEGLQDPDEFSADFQIRLADNFRELEKIRLELIRLLALMPEPAERENHPQSNLFAELDSVTFGQMFRLGWAFFLPLILAILLGTLLLTLAVVFTFRVGL